MRGVLAGVSVISAVVLLAGCDQPKDAPKPTAGPPKGALVAENTDAAAPGAAVATPTRKPGQWEHAITVGGQTRSFKICLDAALDKRLAWWGSSINANACDKQTIARQSTDTWTFHSVCRTVSGGVTTTDGGAQGDFSSRYLVVAQMVTSGSPDPRANISQDMSVDATWLGPCPAGMRAGDIQLPNGQVRNIAELTKAQGAR